MKVTYTYEYNPSDDSIRFPANYVQIVTVRGQLKSWKQEIFFDFDRKINKTLLFEIVSALYDVDFDVVGIVSDMGPSNQSLWKELDITISKDIFQFLIFIDSYTIFNVLLQTKTRKFYTNNLVFFCKYA